jgi:hypothetical protein
MEKKHALGLVDGYTSALDWLTVTSYTPAALAQEFHEFGEDYMWGLFATDKKEEKTKIGAYVGSKIGEVSFVRRPYDGHEMIVATGFSANELAENLVKHNVPARPRRIDAQVTASIGRPDSQYPDRLREHLRGRKTSKGSHYKTRIGCFDSNGGVTGITVGARSSAKYGRVYDWDAKHGLCAAFRLWRHEIEFKDIAAEKFFGEWRAGSNRAATIAEGVKGAFDKYGIELDWLQTDKLIVITGNKNMTDDEKRLAHLDKVLFPMLAGLIERGNLQAVQELIIKHKLQYLFKV